MPKQQNLSKYQKFEAVTIHRGQITGAPYNPRTISAENKNLLKKNLKKRGLLETLIWNKTTGNLVGGHQRLKIMDELEGSDDYSLTVSMVELSDQEEKEQNIFLNNPNSQGEWDRDLMLEIIPDIDAKAAGLTDADLSAIGIEMDLEKYEDKDVEDVIAKFETVKGEQKEQKRIEREANPNQKDWKQYKKEIKENIEKNNDVREDYFVVSFDNVEHKEAFLKRFGFDVDERYIKGEVLTNIINDHLGE
ncbi:MAG: ParB N-terminal domain-containing protein [Marinifilum sp.]|jgi:hypothetical protein|nr:ParB N-terminal domain-containing protein [Marinifilum sp.]